MVVDVRHDGDQLLFDSMNLNGILGTDRQAMKTAVALWGVLI